MKRVFINYRRSDSKRSARGLYSQLQHRLGRQHVFMDVSSIGMASKWPDRIDDAISNADVLLCLIGDDWLSATDRYHRRRIDHPDDWVRREIRIAIERGIPILPILIGESAVPASEALPEDISALPSFQARRLRDEEWEDDVENVIRWLTSEHRFLENQKRIVLPDPAKRTPVLTDMELDNLRNEIPKWEMVESEVPGEYPQSRHELRRVFRLDSFQEAIRFMEFSSAKIDDLNHHPRWENIWKSVTVYSTTWDVGNRITKHDVVLAKLLDELYSEFRSHAKA
ncbi:MAG: 4a-hydroxytetrahydrobiopterin dehydratase [Verrucomicrobiota bacterium]